MSAISLIPKGAEELSDKLLSAIDEAPTLDAKIAALEAVYMETLADAPDAKQRLAGTIFMFQAFAKEMEN